MEFNCEACGHLNQIDIHHHPYKSTPSLFDIHDIELFNNLGHELDLTPHFATDGEQTMFLCDFAETGLTLPTLFYHTCEQCSRKYLALVDIEGDSGRIFYSTSVDRVCEIVVDEVRFIKFFKLWL